MLRKYNVYKDWEPFEKFDEEKEPKSIYFDQILKHKVTEQSKNQLKD